MTFLTFFVSKITYDDKGKTLFGVAFKGHK